MCLRRYTPYPVILSLEMHCKLPGQQRIAVLLKELLKDQLAMPPPAGQPLPSPEALKNKFVVKGKGPGEEAADSLAEVQRRKKKTEKKEEEKEEKEAVCSLFGIIHS